MTYWSAVVDESDLCFLGGFPGAGLREVFGVWEEESQSYYPHESVGISMVEGNVLGLSGNYRAVDTCSVIHAGTAQVLATYSDQYFAGSPVLTRNTFGQGTAYYLAARTRDNFLADFYRRLIADAGIDRVIEADLPAGVTAQRRSDGEHAYVFLMNFNDYPEQVELDQAYTDLLSGETTEAAVTLERFAVRVLKSAGQPTAG
jgi:beta-galactosidase